MIGKKLLAMLMLLLAPAFSHAKIGSFDNHDSDNSSMANGAHEGWTLEANVT